MRELDGVFNNCADKCIAFRRDDCHIVAIELNLAIKRFLGIEH